MRWFALVAILSQFAVVPFFLSVDKVSKVVFFSIFILIPLLSRAYYPINKRFFYGSFVFMLLFVPHLSVNECLLSSFLFLLIFYTSILNTCEYNCVAYKKIFGYYSFFIVIVSVLGMYEYYSSCFVRLSDKMLIPYLLPTNGSWRVGGIYGQPNLFSLLLLTGILVFLYQYLHNNDFSSCRFHRLKYLPFLIVSVAFFLTGSRSGLLSLLLIYLPLCWLVVRRRYLAVDVAKRRQFIVISFVLLLSFGVSLAHNYFANFGAVRGLGETGISTDARFVFWTSAILIFLDHPWFGVGLDNFKLYLPKYASQSHDLLGFVQYEAVGYTKWAHNELLQLLCEGGIFVFLVVVILIGWLFFQLYLYCVGREQWSPLKLYSHLFLLPFFIQSMFSWPMRNPALLMIFFTFLGLLLSQYTYETVVAPLWASVLIRAVSLFGLLLILFVGVQEFKIGSFVHNMERINVQASFLEFEYLLANPYAEYPLLLKVTPRYVYTALKEKDVVFANHILPYVKKLVDLQGAHWQWYNLSLIYHLLGHEEKAKHAIDQAIHQRSTDETYWAFQHYLNMLEASRKTGRPLEEFLPNPPEGITLDIREEFVFDDQIKVGI